jgi:hypothetical protein
LDHGLSDASKPGANSRELVSTPDAAAGMPGAPALAMTDSGRAGVLTEVLTALPLAFGVSRHFEARRPPSLVGDTCISEIRAFRS